MTPSTNNGNFADNIATLVHDITLAQAIEMTDKLNSTRPTFDDCIGGSNVVPISETFNTQAIQAIISQENTVAFRAYFGLDAANQLRLIFVGVNAEGQDIINSGGVMMDIPNIAEAGQRYP